MCHIFSHASQVSFKVEHKSQKCHFGKQQNGDCALDNHYLIARLAPLLALEYNFQLHKMQLELKDIVEGGGKNVLKDFLSSQMELKLLRLNRFGLSVNRVLGNVSRTVLNANVPEELIIYSKLVKFLAGKHTGQIKMLTLMMPFNMKKILLLAKFLEKNTCSVKSCICIT